MRLRLQMPHQISYVEASEFCAKIPVASCASAEGNFKSLVARCTIHLVTYTVSDSQGVVLDTLNLQEAVDKYNELP